MTITISNGYFTNAGGTRKNITVSHDGELLDFKGNPMPSPFEYTLDDSDPAPMAQAIKVLLVAQAIELAEYVSPPPPAPRPPSALELLAEKVASMEAELVAIKSEKPA